MTSNDAEFKRAAVIGMGSVGSGWAALMLAKGMTVRAYDPAPDGEARSKALITGSWPSLVQLGLTDLAQPAFETLSFHDAIADTVRDAEVIFENVPEKLSLKHDVLTEVSSSAPIDALILSSAGGLPTTELQRVCENPARVVVMHPFNPAHLIPLVEIVPGKHTADATVESAHAFARAIGKYPITIKKESTGHMVNRLQFALVRESIRCMMDGVASPQDIDAAVRYGLAPRWVLMGGLQTVALAGGPGGMRGIIDHAGEAMQSWWTTHEDVVLNDAVKEKLIDAAADLAGEGGFEDWASWRDTQLVTLLNFLSETETTRPDVNKEQKK
ncbi:MAG: 3-hydroxyacyl-CoA dehydrogenase NAD-binding domain-containing protein [Pseudomonadota bacterium]